jgi:hypothetical protein
MNGHPRPARGLPFGDLLNTTAVLGGWPNSGNTQSWEAGQTAVSNPGLGRGRLAWSLSPAVPHVPAPPLSRGPTGSAPPPRACALPPTSPPPYCLLEPVGVRFCPRAVRALKGLRPLSRPPGIAAGAPHPRPHARAVRLAPAARFPALRGGLG